MKTVNLNGTWRLFQADKPETNYPAPVPGCIHDALLDAKVIQDINWRLNEYEALWVAEKDWIYEREFNLDEDFLREKFIRLKCDGLDTLAHIEINGTEVAHTNNMFRIYEFDVKKYLISGTNKIRVRFDSVLPVMAERTKEFHLPAWNEDTKSWDPNKLEPVPHWGYTGRGYIRKQACQFGWDWGPMTPSAGIWRDISLVAWSKARISDWKMSQEHLSDGAVMLEVSVSADRPVALKADLKISSKDEEPICLSSDIFHVEKTFRVKIEKPKLWWPNGLGEQNLYNLDIILKDIDGTVLDSIHKRIGLRTLKLVREPDQYGTSFVFEANGQRFFAKGSNWIPVDQYPSSRNLENRYRYLLESAKIANMNMLRIWGGGYFSHDILYDLCDELGICVWQDMMFGCGVYPIWDEAFMRNVYQEVVDNAKRLRHHASLACWCGNNELEMGFCAEDWSNSKMSWNSYFELFERVIPSALKLADPATAYIPGSPHSEPPERKVHDSPRSGDLHSWEIWFTEAPFENYRKLTHRFISEFGFQSFPEPRTINSFTLPEDRKFDSEILVKRQRSAPGNPRVLLHTRDWLGDCDDFDAMCFRTQIVHGNGLKIGIEHFRRNWPMTAGATYWQLNDCWPAQTWSSIDCFGRWKATHYFARRFFAPILVSALEKPDEKLIEVYLNNDLRIPLSGKVIASVYEPSGRLVREKSFKVKLSQMSVKNVGKVDLSKIKSKFAADDLITFLEFVPDSSHSDLPPPLYENVVFLKQPRLIPFERPQIKFDVSENQDGVYSLIISSDKPALWIRLYHEDFDCVFSDNFFCLRPGKEYRITTQTGTKAEMGKFKFALP